MQQIKNSPSLKSTDFISELPKRLIALKGKKRVRAVVVEKHFESIKSTDVFLLEEEENIFQWEGKDANRVKKARAVDIISRLNRKRGQKFQGEVIVLQENKSDDPRFWDILGGKPEAIEMGEDDEKWEDVFDSSTLLYKINENLETEVIEGRKRETLETNFCYFLDCGEEIYVWSGKKTSVEYRKKAFEKSEEIASLINRPNWVVLQREFEGGESTLFEEKFSDWPDSFHKVMGKNMGLLQSNISFKIDQSKPPVRSLFEGTPKEIVDYTQDLSGTLKIYKICGLTLEEIPEEIAIFYNSECYLVLYEYQRQAIIYFWQGSGATVKEKGLCGQIAKDLNMTINNKAKLSRVEEGSESRHFLSLLKGKFLIFDGKDNSPRKEVSLFQMRGTFQSNMKTLECMVSSSYLYSEDIFFLKTPEKIFIWYGSKCNSNTKNAAPFVAKKINKDLEVVSLEEGEETEEFWEKIGGKMEYIPYEDPKKNKARFWVCENVNKTYKCYELSNFIQSELTCKRQAILDRYTEVLVWIEKTQTKMTKKLLQNLL